MKKIVSLLLVIILVLVAVELGGSYYVGNFAEKRYRQVVALINETPGVSVEILSYKKGWFRSQLETQIKTVQNTLLLKSTIIHGPFIFDPSLRPFFQVGLAVQKGEFDNLDSMLGIPGKVQWAMRFPFTGGINFGVDGEEADYQHKTVYISSKAWKGEGSVSRDLKSYQYDAHYPEIVIRERKDMTKGPQLRFSGIKTDVEYKNDENERKLEGSYSVDSIAGEGGIPGVLNGLTLSHIVKILPETMELDLDSKIQHIGFFNQQYGPGVLKLELVNLDRAAIQSLWDMYIANQNSPTPDAAANQAKLMAAAKAILVRKPKLMVDELSFTLLEGTVSGKGNLTLGGPEITDPTDTNQLMQTMEGNINAVIPKTVFRTMAKQQARQNLAQNPQAKTMDPQQLQASIDQGADQFIADLMKNEILTEKDANTYEIKVSFSKGRWMAGGHVVTLPQATAPTPLPGPTPPTAPQETPVPTPGQTIPPTSPAASTPPGQMLPTTPKPPTPAPGKTSPATSKKQALASPTVLAAGLDTTPATPGDSTDPSTQPSSIQPDDALNNTPQPTSPSPTPQHAPSGTPKPITGAPTTTPQSVTPGPTSKPMTTAPPTTVPTPQSTTPAMTPSPAPAPTSNPASR